MMKWLPTDPRSVFAAVSMILIVVMIVAVCWGQTVFFRNAVIQREAVIMHDMVTALASEYLVDEDVIHYTAPTARRKFVAAFGVLADVTGVTRLKVYDSKGVVIWSDAPELVGRRQAGTVEDLVRMQAGLPSDIFDPTTRQSFETDNLPSTPLIEFYVPFHVHSAEGAEVGGIVAVYREAGSLSSALRQGTLLLSAIASVGGLVLFFALSRLFRSVYRRQREAESKFAQLSSQHRRIVQMEKLSAVGNMVAEIAHQFNNPLVGVINLTQLAEREAGNPQRVRELLGDIGKAGYHCRDFVQRMLDFSRPARYQPQPTDLPALLRETIAFHAMSGGDGTPVQLTTSVDITLAVDPVLMRHALFNLIHNAVQADPHGTVEVGLESETCDDQPGWAIAVADRGPGLSPQVLKHLLTPFFTTRKDGTGLGVPVADQIAAVHGGRLRPENRPGGGARFVIWLPATREGYEAENLIG
jgi:signal transduction histidine kinase